jgi:hypothetical protein
LEVALLAEKGIKVRPTLVYYIKSMLKKRQKKVRRQHVREASRQTETRDPVELILKVKQLAREAGGISYLKQLVDILAK